MLQGHYGQTMSDALIRVAIGSLKHWWSWNTIQEFMAEILELVSNAAQNFKKLLHDHQCLTPW